MNRLTGEQIVQLWGMYQGEWWSRGRRLDDVRRAVQHSDLIFAFCDPDTGGLAAFARVLTDFVYKAVIFDVIVAREYRNLGVGRMLLDAITARGPRADAEEVVTTLLCTIEGALLLGLSPAMRERVIRRAFVHLVG